MRIIKFLPWLVVFLLAIVPTWAWAGSETADQTSGAKVRQELKETAQAVEGYTVEQRDQAVSSVKTTLQDLDENIRDMENTLDREWHRMDDAARRESQEALRELRKQRTALAEWYGGLKHGSTQAWGQVKKGFLESINSLSEAFEGAQREFMSGGEDR
jgi:chromosome segregation ATPase